MSFPTDLEIAQNAKMQNIKEIAKKLNINEDDLEQYGKYKAKLPLTLIDSEKIKKNKLILVTAITPTPAGEGKTTVSIGLTEGLNKIGKKAVAVLREPSLRFTGWDLEHGGVLETSLMLLLHPELVDMSRVSDDPPAVLPNYDVLPIKPELTPPSGCLSSAKNATEQKGRILLDTASSNMAQAISEEF